MQDPKTGEKFVVFSKVPDGDLSRLHVGDRLLCVNDDTCVSSRDAVALISNADEDVTLVFKEATNVDLISSHLKQSGVGRGSLNVISSRCETDGPRSVG